LENNTKPLQVLELHIETEQKYLSYLLKKEPLDIFNTESVWILNEDLNIIYNCIQSVVDDNLKVELDIVYDRVKQELPHFKFDQLELIRNSFDDFENIDAVKKRLHEQYVKQKLTKKSIADVLEFSTANGDIDYNKAEELHDLFGDSLQQLQREDEIKTYEVLVEDHKEVLRDRKEGKLIRSAGMPNIDPFLTYKGEAGDMLSFVMLKGNGKTIYGQNCASYLTNIGTCVSYFAFDMGQATMMDRTLVHRDGFNSSDLVSYSLNRDDIARLRKSMNDLSEIKNYVQVSTDLLTLKDIDRYFYQIKAKFKKLGVLPEDEYFVAIFDTLDMVADFSKSETGYHIKNCINKLHAILRKHKVFAINLLQANENKLRTRRFNNPDALNTYRVGIEDIEGGASYSSRSRVVLAGNRPLHLKKMMFPTHEDRELWDTEEDIFHINICKQNDGGLRNFKHVLDVGTYRVYPYIET